MIALCLFFITSTVHAAFEMGQLDKSEIDGANRDFSALFAHTTVSPASGLLKKGGFELGLIAGTSSIPNIYRAITAQDPNSSMPSRLPNAGFIGAYAFVKNLTLEIKIVPEIEDSANGFSMGSQSLGLKFSFPELMADPAVITAFRLQATNAYITTNQTINNSSTGNVSVEAKTKFASFSYGAAALLGYRNILAETFLVEPFIGAGVIRADSKYEVMADIPASIFFTGSSVEGSSQTGALFILGAQANMFFSKLGIEYSRVFDSDKMTFKLSFGY